MKLTHLGRIVDLDPEQTAIENRIVLTLFKHKAVKQSKLFYLTNSGRFGEDAYKQAIERLVSEDVIARGTTTHKGSFIISLTEWGKLQADGLNYAATKKWGGCRE